VGLTLPRRELQAILAGQGYRSVERVTGPGEYLPGSDSLLVHIRGFTFADGLTPSLRVAVGFDRDRVTGISDVAGKPIGIVRVPPAEIARIYPRHREDRQLVQLAEVPLALIDALVAIEDRNFFQHHGLDPRAIARAAWVNLWKGRISQGGSTLTQQLVKNFYLNADRTVWRKANEAIMALLLEAHYSKGEILQAYLNEIYLGQAGSRAIHGFGMAAQHYFARPLMELSTDQLALLAGLAKGASLYQPRRHPKRATDRRNLVLRAMGELKMLETAQVLNLQAAPLGISSSGQAAGRHPGFMDLVRRQIRSDYRDEDLGSAGLRIFTTLDLRAQTRAERTVSDKLSQLETARRIEAGSLQAALIAAEPANGEVVALVAGRDAAFPGFNRVLSARRPIGSLIKPAIYLAALHNPDRYDATTLLNDTAVEISNPNGEVWRPNNYDGVAHGQVPLASALIRSYNLATINLGLELGYPALQTTLASLGVEGELPHYPAVFLGAVESTPFEMAQMYQTFAGGGYQAPLRSIRAVLDSKGRPLTRYGLKMRQTVADTEAFVLTHLLSKVITDGTGRSALPALQGRLPLAGKTGTTDELRDSWFGGYGSNLVGVVWVGRDDNRPAGLTGASGALQVWADFMRGSVRPLSESEPAGIRWHKVDIDKSATQGDCAKAQLMPFIGERTEPLARLCE